QYKTINYITKTHAEEIINIDKITCKASLMARKLKGYIEESLGIQNLNKIPEYLQHIAKL
ncbi:hypothetical protein ACJX0J_010833, partial [Zea mays]